MSILRQLLCTIVVSYSSLTVGLVFTWPSSIIQLFRSEHTPLHRPMSETELALVGSVSSIGAMIATPAAGWLLDYKGRKFCAVLFALIHVMGWAMMIASNRIEVLLTALFVAGLGNGAFFVTPVYITDFCQESIRGQMASGPWVLYGFGSTISYAMGGFLDYYVMLYTCLGMAVGGVMLLWPIKESPLYLMLKGREEEAKESIAFFRNVKPDSKEALQEIETIRRGLDPVLENTDSPEEEFALKPAAKKKKLSVLQFIRSSYSTRRALTTALTFLTVSVLQGGLVLQVYAEPLFAEAVPTMSATVSSMLFSLVAVTFGLVTGYLTDIVGRKPLMLYSSLGTSVCCVLLGSQIHVHWGAHAVSAFLVYLFCAVYTVGAGTIPYVMTPEMFLPEIKSFATMLVTEWVWFISFVILFVFNPLVSLIGLGPVFYIFAVVCLLSAVFTHFWLPETTGLPVDEIQLLFSKKHDDIKA